MASGIPQAKWNNADITGTDVDLDAISAWYAARDVPWELRVPLGVDVALGRPLFVKRCVGIPAEAYVLRLNGGKRRTRVVPRERFAFAEQIVTPKELRDEREAR